MLVIPAIDIKDGQCVRLKQGDFSSKTVYENEPVKVAFSFQEAGAKRLHVVDLDGAESGVSINQSIIKSIIAEVDLPIQIGGGLRTFEQIEHWLTLGVDRVVVGTLAVAKPEILEKALEKFGSAKVVLAIDVRAGKVAIEGWQKDSDVEAADLALKFQKFGLERILYTDISRDGMFSGPNIPSTRDIAEKTGMKVIASGGVSSLADLNNLQALEPYGVDSVVIGRAFYERRILPEEVFDAG